MNLFKTVARGALLVVVGIACGGSDAAPAGPPVPVEDVLARLDAVTDTVNVGTVGAQLPTPPAVMIRKKSGAPATNVAVAFTVTLGSGAVGSSTATTGADGIARTTWTLGPTAGPQLLTASATGLTAVTFRATATVAAAARLTKVDGDAQTTVVGVPTPRPIVVKVADQFGNPVSGVAVAAAIKSGQGTLATGTVTTDGAGLASFSTWSMGTRVGSNSVELSVPGLEAVTFAATANPGPVAALAFTSADTLFLARGSDAAIEVRATDRFGNDVVGAPTDLRIGNTAVGTISGARVTGLAIGVTSVTATSGLVSVARPLVVLGHPTGTVVAQRLSVPGTWFAMSTANGVIAVSSIAPAGVRRFDAGGSPVGGFTPLPIPPWELALTPDASRVLAMADASFHLVNFSDGSLTSTLVTGYTGLSRMSRDGKRQYVLTNSNLITEVAFPFDPSRRTLQAGFAPVYALGHGESDSVMYAVSGYLYGFVSEIDARDFRVKRSWAIQPATDLAVSRDGRYLYVGLFNRELQVIRAADQSIVKSLVMDQGINSMLVSPDGKKLFVTWNSSRQLRVFDLADPADPRLERVIELGGAPSDIQFDPHGAFLIVALIEAHAIEIVR